MTDSRREFLIRSGAFLALTLPSRHASAFQASPKFTAGPFGLGVASGDPWSDSVVLWTRLMPDPARQSVWQRDKVPVRWMVAEDEGLTRVVRRGEATATPELGHSVHVEADGLRPGRWYWYQFIAGGVESPVGRTRTMPSGAADSLRFAFVSCQHYETGYYTAYRHMCGENLDLIVHLGDYIYEGGIGDNRVRRHDGPEIVTLEDYRNRYALYHSDKDLQGAHRLIPFVATWDDHEVDNDYANDKAEATNPAPRDEFLKRRAAAYQAYYEFLPLRRSSMPKGPDMQIYRRVSFGRLAQFHVLDTRQYRDQQACGIVRLRPACPELTEPKRTILGERQEQWLFDGLASSPARWNVIANQVMLGRVNREAGEPLYSTDKWDGYPPQRQRLLDFLASRKPANPVIVTGDIHSNWVMDIKQDPTDAASRTVATEFVGTSISSGGDGSPDLTPELQAMLNGNPQIHLHNRQRGYVTCHANAKRMETRYRIVEKVSVPGHPATTLATFVVEDGKPGAHKT
jgi:alkaline phosphatase D